nr:FecR family protein [uncultured Dyadobacter sp.]
MDKEIYIRNLLYKYLADQCTEQEQDELLAHLQTPVGKWVFDEVINSEAGKIFGLPQEIEPAISDRILGRLQQSIDESDATEKVVPLFRKANFWRIAAVLTGFLMIFGIGFYHFKGTRPQTVSTGKGQMQTIMLPDGSRVILNASSSISYEKQWNGKATREVTLEGEAFFDVAHNPSQPFFVKTGRMEIRVLGTAFNVKSWNAQRIFETTLVRGKVTIKDHQAPENKETVLQPNEQAVLSPQSAKLETATITVHEDSYWHKGRLIFEDEPVEVIARELEKWYHVKISVEEDSKDCRFNFNVDRETLPEVLKLLEAVTGAVPLIDGKNVSIKGKLCSDDVM